MNFHSCFSGREIHRVQRVLVKAIFIHSTRITPQLLDPLQTLIPRVLTWGIEDATQVHPPSLHGTAHHAPPHYVFGRISMHVCNHSTCVHDSS